MLVALGKGLSVLARSKMLWLLVGGAVGTYARYGLGRWIAAHPWAQGFPYHTLIINVSGSFVLGLAAVLFLEGLRPEYEDWFHIVGVGFCGGYTTFSTFEWETYKLVRAGSWPLALANVAGSVIAGFVGVLLGVGLAHLVFPERLAGPRGEAVKTEADAKLVTIYLNSSDLWHGRPLYSAILRLCRQKGIAGATVVRCDEGYGAGRRLHTTRLLELSESLPLCIEVIDLAERVEPLLTDLTAMIDEGLVTISDVHVLQFRPATKA
jgi:protein CrcB